jgi:hypothetical protein
MNARVETKRTSVPKADLPTFLTRPSVPEACRGEGRGAKCNTQHATKGPQDHGTTGPQDQSVTVTQETTGPRTTGPRGMYGFNPSHPSQVQEGAGAKTFRIF